MSDFPGSFLQAPSGAPTPGGAFFYFMPSILPSLFLRPDFVIGIPVALEILRLAFVTPRARFQLNVTPGILNFLRFAIVFSFHNSEEFSFSISAIYPAVMMPAGSATIAIPNNEEIMVNICPIVETGYISPYPTVVREIVAQ